MTVRRLGIGMVDDERTCITCNRPAPAEPFQHELPEQAARLRRHADFMINHKGPMTVQMGVAEFRRRAAAIDAEIKKAVIPAFLCADCLVHVHDSSLVAGWGGGRHDIEDTAFIQRTVAYVRHPDHQAGRTGACMVCRPDSKIRREEIPA